MGELPLVSAACGSTPELIQQRHKPLFNLPLGELTSASGRAAVQRLKREPKR